MKKTLIFLLCITAALSFAACNSRAVSGAVSKTESETGDSLGSAEIANPIVDYDTLEEAIEITGFDMTVPDTIGEFTDRTVQVIGNELIQVIYQNGYIQISIRKATGSDDISGDYNEYEEIRCADVGDLQITMKGADGVAYLAIWANGGYSYSVNSTSGLSYEAMIELAAEIN